MAESTTMQEAIAIAEKCGFTHAGEMNVSKLEFLPEVRQMCAAGKCNRYGKSWSCPPACGELEELEERTRNYQHGIIVQSTGNMDDDFDVETMQETEHLQKQRFFAFVDEMRKREPDCLPMAAGSCTVCETCSYPKPCRFPEKMIPSMEAYGIFVSKLCEDSGIGYYYGKQTITYTSCILW